MPVTEWYCAAAVALDAESDEQYLDTYYAYIAAGGDPKEFPKRKKKGGEDDVISKVARVLGSHKGNIEEYAKVRNLPVVKRLPDGRFVDENGNEIEIPDGMIFIPSGEGL